VPDDLEKILDRCADDDAAMVDAGSDYAARQIASLWSEGVDGVHLYTMNKSSQILDIVRGAFTRVKQRLWYNFAQDSSR
jgi:5,10-methylenetetrahydrofolate reductase